MITNLPETTQGQAWVRIPGGLTPGTGPVPPSSEPSLCQPSVPRPGRRLEGAAASRGRSRNGGGRGRQDGGRAAATRWAVGVTVCIQTVWRSEALRGAVSPTHGQEIQSGCPGVAESCGTPLPGAAPFPPSLSFHLDPHLFQRGCCPVNDELQCRENPHPYQDSTSLIPLPGLSKTLRGHPGLASFSGSVPRRQPTVNQGTIFTFPSVCHEDTVPCTRSTLLPA